MLTEACLVASLLAAAAVVMVVVVMESSPLLLFSSSSLVSYVLLCSCCFSSVYFSFLFRFCVWHSKPVKVCCEATLVFPLIVSQTFAKDGPKEPIKTTVKAKAKAADVEEEK
jgi:hypothetical protein